jgi:hypothetical protein
MSQKGGIPPPSAIAIQWQECANSGHTPAAWRTSQIDLKLLFVVKNGTPQVDVKAPVADRGLGRLNWADSAPRGVAAGKAGAWAKPPFDCEDEIAGGPHYTATDPAAMVAEIAWSQEAQSDCRF